MSSAGFQLVEIYLCRRRLTVNFGTGFLDYQGIRNSVYRMAGSTFAIRADDLEPEFIYQSNY